MSVGGLWIGIDARELFPPPHRFGLSAKSYLVFFVRGRYRFRTRFEVGRTFVLVIVCTLCGFVENVLIPHQSNIPDGVDIEGILTGTWRGAGVAKR